MKNIIIEIVMLKHMAYIEALEFGVSEYKELKKFASDIKIDFFATPFDLDSVEFLSKLNMPLYK